MLCVIHPRRLVSHLPLPSHSILSGFGNKISKANFLIIIFPLGIDLLIKYLGILMGRVLTWKIEFKFCKHVGNRGNNVRRLVHMLCVLHRVASFNFNVSTQSHIDSQQMQDVMVRFALVENKHLLILVTSILMVHQYDGRRSRICL